MGQDLQKKRDGSLWLIYGLVGMLLLVLPLFLDDSKLSLVGEMMIMALAAVSLNMLLGDANLVSFGHAGFFALGGYTFGLLSYFHLVPFFAAVLLALVAVLIYSLIVGWFVVKLVEIYFSLLCLAFAQLIWVVARVWYGVTGGDDGLNGIPVIECLVPTVNSYYLILVVVAISLFLIYTIRLSPFGRSLHAIRDNRTRASAIGIDTKRYIFCTFILSGLFSGIAGILLVVLLHCAFPSYGSWSKSGDFLFVCLLGGMYNFLGPVVGAFIFVFLHFIISKYFEYWSLILGVGIIFIVLYFRGGVVGFIEMKYLAYKKRRELRDSKSAGYDIGLQDEAPSLQEKRELA
jgi:branched-chain amino acid transport system permease protein